MAAEVLAHQQMHTAKTDETSRADAGAGNMAKRNYVPIRPAYRPLLPKPTARDNTPSPIHIHTRTSGISQLACRKRHSNVASKLETSKRRRSLPSRAHDQPATTPAGLDVKLERNMASLPSATTPPSSRASPSPVQSAEAAASATVANLTSVSTSSIFGPPPTTQLETDAPMVFDGEGEMPKPRRASGSMTSMMSALVSRFQRPGHQVTRGIAANNLEYAADFVSEGDPTAVDPSEFTPLSLDRFGETSLEQLDVNQFSKLDLDLESAISTSAAPSLASSAATTTSMSTTDSLVTVASSLPDESKKISSQSPEPFGYASPTAEFDEFTEFYFHTNSRSDSVSPVDGSPDTLGDVLDNEACLAVGKEMQDDLDMMEFLAPSVDLF